MKTLLNIIHGDCLEKLKELEQNSVDSLVTDPPYGLSKEPDIAEVMLHWCGGTPYAHKNRGFMGKSWDNFVPGPEYWHACYRVMKPGSHGLVFAGARTQDLMSIALRFAGFEIRETIMWFYGSGFPKSHNISKAIDKTAGAERKVIGKYHYPDGSVDRSIISCDESRTVLGKGHKGGSIDITTPATSETKRWSGWGTALKPAYEPIILIRKPLSEKTIAANVLKWNCGAINIDASRIGTNDNLNGGTYAKSTTVNGVSQSMAGPLKNAIGKLFTQPQGRFPANLLFSCVCLSETHEENCPVAELDRQSGVLKPGGQKRSNRECKGINTHFGSKIESQVKHTDSGGASRFFYVAKASKRERNLGCEGLEDKESGIKNGSGRGFSEVDPYRIILNRNNHPTVKPQKLMSYLIKLITPEKGIILDPFLGSGSTGVAAKSLGFSFIGIEQDSEYIKIAKTRLEYENGKTNRQ